MRANPSLMMVTGVAGKRKTPRAETKDKICWVLSNYIGIAKRSKLPTVLAYKELKIKTTLNDVLLETQWPAKAKKDSDDETEM